jgi:hypothetical protein
VWARGRSGGRREEGEGAQEAAERREEGMTPMADRRGDVDGSAERRGDSGDGGGLGEGVRSMGRRRTGGEVGWIFFST